MDTCYHFAKTEGLLSQFLALNLLERLGGTANALKVLLENIGEENSTLEHSCGILLRSSFLDGLVAYNLFKKIFIDNENSEKSSEAKEKDINDFCKTILSDGLSNTINHLKMQKDQGTITGEELKNLYKVLVNRKKGLFKPFRENDDKPQLIYNTHYSSIKLFQLLNVNGSKMKKFSNIYESYLYYSKYDHFGTLYSDISRRENFIKTQNIEDSVKALLKIQYALFEILLKCSKDEFVRKKLIKMDTFIIGSKTKS
jgi:hypothetical protein